MAGTRRWIVLAGLVLVLTGAGLWWLQRSQSDRIAIAYVVPTDPEHRMLHRFLADRRVLERFRDYLSPFRLPKTLTLKLDQCGVANAWYEPEDSTITVCYEYIADVVRKAPMTTTPDGVTREDALVGPLTEVFLHEVAHALFDLYEVPLMGREEDAADQVAAYLLLQLSKNEARRTVIGTAYMYLTEARTFTPELHHYADVHGLPAQRLYNLICIAFGGDKVLFSDAVEKNMLPKSRAESCEEEYQQVAFAFGELLSPHLDKRRTKALKGREWFRFDPPPAPPTRHAGPLPPVVGATVVPPH